MRNNGKGNALECSIYGKDDDAIAETVTFLCSLKHSGERFFSLQIDSISQDISGEDSDSYNNWRNFDFAAFKPVQIAQILDANPTRRLELAAGRWSPEQGVLFATRSYPLNLVLFSDFAFRDNRKAFVDALEKREATFGSLCIKSDSEEIPFGRDSLARLYKIETLGELSICYIDDLGALLPFAAKVETLTYTTHARCFQPNDFHSLEIATKNLYFKLFLEGWDALLISFLN